MSELDAMRVFVEVVERGGFSAAGRALEMPRSTVSRRVQALEERLGARLLQRTTRTLQLTEIGEGYFERGREAVRLANAADRWVQSRTEAPRGVLRITTFELFAATLLGPVLVAYLEQNPGMSVQVLISERNTDLVDEKIDLAIRIGALQDSTLVVRKFADLGGMLVASPSYVEAHGLPAHPRDLTSHANMLYGHGSEQASLTFGFDGEEVVVGLPSRCVANSIALVRQVALGGLVIGVLPPVLVEEDIATGRLVQVLPEWSMGVLPIYVAYPNRSHLAQKVRAFVNLLVATG